MTLRLIALIMLPLASVLAAPKSSPPKKPDASNPLMHESTLPFQYPPFDKMKDEHFQPAIEAGMAEQLQEIDKIANNPEPPTFENTIVAMEKSGRLLDRSEQVFSNLNSANTNPALQKIEQALAPKEAAHRDAIFLNDKLFARVKAIDGQRAELNLDPESAYLLERYEKDFVRAGAKLNAADKEKLKQMNAELAKLTTTFAQNVLKERNASAITVAQRADLAGLSESELASTESAAKEAKKPGKFVIELQNTTGQPLVHALDKRELRQQIMETSLNRNSHGGEFDNKNVVISIARLRAQHAQLLGYPTHAAYQLEDQTAKDVSTVNKLLAQLASPAVTNAKREAADMQKLVEGDKFQVASWDWDYYSDRVKKERYAFDENELKPYFELNHVLLDGVFYAAGKLYGLTFKERHDLPVYHPDVRVFDVFDADGKPLAIFIGDYYARPSKHGGAWMSEYVGQSGLFGTKPVVANHLNIPKPPAGQPTLLTYDEARTAFHEFGHALHGMFSNVKYPRFAGTSVPRDFVEYPSQVNEMWQAWPEVLKNYAKHYQTGAPLPQELFDKVLASEKFNQGFKTTEYLSATLLDQAWHQLSPEQIPTDALAFEADALRKAGVDYPPVPPRYRSAYFSHAFAGGYSAGYYSYIWSEVLDADSVEWFKQHGGLTRENGDHFRQTLLSRGGSVDAMKLFHDFTGRDPYIEPLLERRGLNGATPPAQAAPSSSPAP